MLLKEYKEKKMQDPEFRAAYDETRPEFDAIKKVVNGMNDGIKYKGYTGSVEWSEDDDCFFGQVMGIRSCVLYEGSTVAELVEDFHGAVDDYLEICRAYGDEPEIPENNNRKENQ